VRRPLVSLLVHLQLVPVQRRRRDHHRCLPLPHLESLPVRRVLTRARPPHVALLSCPPLTPRTTLPRVHRVPRLHRPAVALVTRPLVCLLGHLQRIPRTTLPLIRRALRLAGPVAGLVTLPARRPPPWAQWC
jgi:hypothetical protein